MGSGQKQRGLMESMCGGGVGEARHQRKGAKTTKI